jgi:uncharacterized protein
MAVGQLHRASLLVDGKPLDVVVEVAADRTSQRRGLLGRDHVEGAMWFPGVRSVHTVKMRCAIDVAQVDQTGAVMGVRTMQPNRIGSWRRNCAGILEAAAGAFVEWGISPGTKVEVSDGW